jgi:hypothetical protein
MDLVVTTARNGQGIYAARDFVADEVLYEITGTFISGDVDEEIDEAIRDNSFRYSDNLYLSPAGTIGDFQNHSCEPNAKVLKQGDALVVAAISSIQKGGEILIDYSTITGADDVWEMACNCGSASCRGVVRNFDALPHELRARYQSRGIVPDYIVALSDS